MTKQNQALAKSLFDSRIFTRISIDFAKLGEVLSSAKLYRDARYKKKKQKKNTNCLKKC